MNNPEKANRVPDADLPGDRFVNNYLPALLAQASQLISSEFHEVARQHGFSVSEWRVMASLTGSEPLSIGLAALHHAVEQPRHGGRITPEGTKAVEQLIALAREHERRVLEPFGLARAEDLKQVLRQMIAQHVHVPVDPPEDS